MINRVCPNKIRFIKLGEGGKWEARCLSEGTVRLGYESPHHEASLRGEWETVWNYWLAERKGNQRSASSDVNQIRDFYEVSSDDLWITFHGKHLYWCHAATEVVLLPDGSRSRKALGGWRKTDLKGGELRIDRLDGRVTKVRGYQGTICGVELPEYLARKINGDIQPDVAAAMSSLETLKKDAAALIRGLGWKDFELLIELMFSRAGWQRYSSVGATEKDTDLDLVAPLSGRRAFVQVKSSTSRAQIHEYISRWQSHGHEEFYFVYHSASEDLTDLHDQAGHIYLLGLVEIAERVVLAGLTQWLIDKRS